MGKTIKVAVNNANGVFIPNLNIELWKEDVDSPIKISDSIFNEGKYEFSVILENTVEYKLILKIFYGDKLLIDPLIRFVTFQNSPKVDQNIDLQPIIISTHKTIGRVRIYDRNGRFISTLKPVLSCNLHPTLNATAVEAKNEYKFNLELFDNVQYEFNIKILNSNDELLLRNQEVISVLGGKDSSFLFTDVSIQELPEVYQIIEEKVNILDKYSSFAGGLNVELWDEQTNKIADVLEQEGYYSFSIDIENNTLYNLFLIIKNEGIPLNGFYKETISIIGSSSIEAIGFKTVELTDYPPSVETTGSIRLFDRNGIFVSGLVIKLICKLNTDFIAEASEISGIYNFNVNLDKGKEYQLYTAVYDAKDNIICENSQVITITGGAKSFYFEDFKIESLPPIVNVSGKVIINNKYSNFFSGLTVDILNNNFFLVAATEKEEEGVQYYEFIHDFEDNKDYALALRLKNGSTDIIIPNSQTIELKAFHIPEIIEFNEIKLDFPKSINARGIITVNDRNCLPLKGLTVQILNKNNDAILINACDEKSGFYEFDILLDEGTGYSFYTKIYHGISLLTTTKDVDFTVTGGATDFSMPTVEITEIVTYYIVVFVEITDENGNVMPDLNVEIFDNISGNKIGLAQYKELKYSLPAQLESNIKYQLYARLSKNNKLILDNSLNFSNVTGGENNVNLDTIKLSQLYSISGLITDAKDNPQKGYTIKVYSKSFEQSKLITEGISSDTGKYDLFYQKPSQANNLIIDLYNGEEKISSSGLLEKVQNNAEINFNIDNQYFVGKSYFERIPPKVKDLFQSVSKNSEIDNISIKLLSKEYKQPEYDLMLLFRAFHMAKIFKDEQFIEIFFGLLKSGINVEPKYLFNESKTNLKIALGQAIEKNIISDRISIEKTVAELKKKQIEITIYDEFSFFDILSKGIEIDKATFINLYCNNERIDDVFWKGLFGDEYINNEKYKILKNNIEELSFWDYNFELFKKLPPKTTSISERLSKNYKYFKDIALKAEYFPDFIEGETINEKRNNYAQYMTRKTELAYPKQYLKGIVYHVVKDEYINKFLESNPDFDFLTGKIENKDITEFPENSIIIFKKVQRISNLLTSENKYESFNFLYKNYNSAHQIVLEGKQKFLELAEQSLVKSKANEIYKKAEKRSKELLIAYTQNRANAITLPTTVLSNSNDENILGSYDTCNCNDAFSVFSPASYLIDNLNFLKNINFSGKNLYDKLLERRPDIAKIEMNEANSETLLPYIDIVNEVLENATTGNLGKEDYQTNWSSEEIFANPEYIEDEAYKILSGNRNSLQLPFYLHKEEINEFLNIIDFSIYQLREKLNIKNEFIIETENENINREQLDAWDILNITKEERDLLISQITPSEYAKLGKVTDLMSQTELTYNEIEELLTSKIVNPEGGKIQFEPSPCSLDNAQMPGGIKSLMFFNYKRLLNKTGWTVLELDKVILRFNKDENQYVESFFTDDLIINISKIILLQNLTNLKVEELLLLWENKLYSKWRADDQLFGKTFLTNNIEKAKLKTFKVKPIGDSFQIDGTTTKKLTDFYHEISSNVNISIKDLQKIELYDEKLSVKNLNQIHRTQILSQALDLSISEYLKIQRVSGLRPIIDKISEDVTPQDTLDFIYLIKKIKSTKLNINDIEYFIARNNTSSEYYVDDKSLDFWNLYDSLITNVGKNFETLYSEKNEILYSYLDDNNNEVTIGQKELITLKEIYSLFEEEFNIDTKFLNRFFVSEFEEETGIDLVILTKLLNESPLTTDADKKILRSFLNEIIVDRNQNNIKNIYKAVHHFLLYVNYFKINLNDVFFIKSNEYLLNIFELPNQFNKENFITFLNLSHACHIQNKYFNDKEKSFFKLLVDKRKTHEVFENTGEVPQYDFISEPLHKFFNWDQKVLEKLFVKFNFEDFKDPQWFDKIQNIMQLINDFGVDYETLLEWGIFKVLDFSKQQQISNQIKNAVKSQYTTQQWQEVAPGIQKHLREKRRNALCNYLISKYNHFSDRNDLYSYFLLDVEMSSCYKTSRIVLAHSVLQLFMQRIELGFEGEDLTLSDEQSREWEWRKKYRLWEANRKVFLYPENWLEPELRTDKSEIFKEFETDLEKGDINYDIAEQALVSYVEKLDKISKLEIVQHFEEDETKILHVIARTYDIPHTYYYRKRDKYNFWSPWKVIEQQLDIINLKMDMIDNKLYLFWPMITENSEIEKEKNLKYFDVKIACVRKDKKNWSEIKISNASYQTIKFENGEKWCKPISYTTYLDKIGLNLNFEKNNNYIIFSLSHAVKNTYQSYGYETWAFQGFQDFKQNINFLIAFNTHTKVFEKYYNNNKTNLWINTHDYIPEFGMYKYPSKKGPDYLGKGECTRLSTNDFHERTYFEEEKEYLKINYTKNKCLFNKLSSFSVLLSSKSNYLNYNLPFIIEDKNKIFLAENINILPTEISAPNSINNQLDKEANTKFDILDDYDRLTPVFKNSIPIIKSNLDFKTLSVSKITKVRGYYQPLNSENEKSVTTNTSNPNVFYCKKYQFSSLYHPFTTNFINDIYRNGVNQLLTLENTELKNPDFFGEDFEPNEKYVLNDYPIENVDFGYSGSYSLYNWELFFHAPLMTAIKLSQNHRFEEAQKWFHFIFNPTISGNDNTRFWRILPFQKEISNLSTNFDDLVKDKNVFEKWEENPFNPHIIAQFRIVAYMKNVLMKYLDNLIAWGDNLFRNDTVEYINQATQIYILAAQILGRRPVKIKGHSFNYSAKIEDVISKLDNFGNATIELENILPSPSLSVDYDRIDLRIRKSLRLINQSIDDNIVNPNTLGGLTTILYFCIPENKKMLSYWDTISDRLFKIRNCKNIDGVERQLALFEPPIDPELLVQATANGLSVGEILSNLYPTNAYYRFRFLLQKAIEFTGEVKSLGQSLLSALEKKDAEQLSLLRANHEKSLLELATHIKEKNIEEQTENIKSLEQSIDNIKFRKDFYRNRKGSLKNKIDKVLGKEFDFDVSSVLSNNEIAQIENLNLSSNLQIKGQGAALIASTLSLLPQIKIGGGSGIEFGGLQLGQSTGIAASVFNLLSSIKNHHATLNSIMAGYERRQEEWNFQVDSTEGEILQIEKQILANQIRKSVAEIDLENHKVQIVNSLEAKEFMESKFTNVELYDWMIREISSMYSTAYNLAYNMAKKAEAAMNKELGSNFSLIKPDNWDSLKQGLLAGEKLSLQLRRLEQSYIESNKREYELTKQVSLAILNPFALLDLKTTGSCDFSIPEVLFDLDHPNHYYRRIKSVSFTIPAVTGPYTNINCKATLDNNRIRTKKDIIDGKYQIISNDDYRFKLDNIAKSIVTSSARNDNGMFEVNFNDERYLPFEGCGVIGNWKLEFDTALPQFDYNTISDVIMTINYTAQESGLKENVKTELTETLNKMLDALSENGTELQRVISLKSEFGNNFHGLINSINKTTTIKLTDKHFPYYLRNRVIINADNISVYSISKNSEINSDIENLIDDDITISKSNDGWNLVNNKDDEGNANIEDIFIVFNYTIS